MAIRQLEDGRWIVYYRESGSGKIKKEYFGRGLKAKNKALKRNKELGFKNPKSKRIIAKETLAIKIIEKLKEEHSNKNIGFEIETKVGFIDVLTSELIIEIKPIKMWKHALGQVLAYGLFIPSKKLKIFFVR